ncbi:hypothetical protein FRC03_012744 [Tulasnella sp. 419]|nr:hypothetical protein FRC03_012744 [Tulasnella sp. 419]
MRVYGSTPLQPEVGIVRCNECNKAILASAIATHAKNCEQIRGGSGKNKAGKDSVSGTKRKPEEETDVPGGPAKKKTKKELAKTTGSKPRVKGPAELDKNCCVINAKGLPCSRSITCKVHSMVAKRSVQGRSKPYDELLLDWKRANVPGFVEPVKRETKAERKAKKEAEKEAKRKEMLAAGIVPGAKKKAKSEGKKGGKKGEKAAGPPGEKGTKGKPGKGPSGAEEDEDEEDLDSEVEMDALIKAVRISRPITAVPLAQPTNMANFFVARNEVLRNCFDTMGFALSGSNIRGHSMAMAA